MGYSTRASQGPQNPDRAASGAVVTPSGRHTAGIAEIRRVCVPRPQAGQPAEQHGHAERTEGHELRTNLVFSNVRAAKYQEADIHAGIFAGLENGTLRPIVGKELPLAEAARAHKEILEPGSAGKIVLIC